MLNRSALKQEAKLINHNARVSAYWMAVLYLVINLVLNAIKTYVQGDPLANMRILYPELALPATPDFLNHQFPQLLVLFVAVMVMLLSCVLDGGYYLYSLSVRRREEMGYDTLFDGFAFAGKLILLYLFISLLVFAWSLLFVVPGIIALYRYRFAVYNLCENPEMGVQEALRMSIAQTDGFKGQLFVLDLSFVGWRFLSLLTFNLLNIWVVPYYVQTDLGFFQEIKKIKQIGNRLDGPDALPGDENAPLF
jgi:uncharacterized membrane protein